MNNDKFIEKVLGKKVSEITDDEIVRLYDCLREPRPGSSVKYCCISFEGFVKDELLFNTEETRGWRIKTEPMIVGSGEWHITSTSIGLNFCPWCGSKLSFFEKGGN